MTTVYLLAMWLVAVMGKDADGTPMPTKYEWQYAVYHTKTECLTALGQIGQRGHIVHYIAPDWDQHLPRCLRFTGPAPSTLKPQPSPTWTLVLDPDPLPGGGLSYKPHEIGQYPSLSECETMGQEAVEKERGPDRLPFFRCTRSDVF
jgi:hypothetical protein